MSTTTVVPARRPDLVLRPVSDDGRHVVKDPVTGSFYNLGPQEAFLLERLDGRSSPDAVCAAFAQRFGSYLSEADLEGFVEMARAQGFLHPPGTGAAPALPAPAPAAPPPAAETASAPPTPAAPAAHARQGGSLLCWRRSLFDPDRFFGWLAPKIRFVWTPGFLVLSALLIAVAGGVAAGNWRQLVADLPGALRWEVLVLAWLALLAATFLHEFAHGLTCKHYGGEVHEVGFLLLLLMPCFYCNVSDAWLFRERRHRLLVTLAGGYCDLCVWAVAVFVWRLTPPATLLHFLAYVVLSVCGGRIFFNFNPFMKLDGYYLLSDWLDIPNLHQRGHERMMAYLRRLLWGAPRPAADERGALLLGYGLVSFLMSLAYLSLMIYAMVLLLGEVLGVVGAVAAALLGALLMRGLFQGFTGGEVARMLLLRRARVAFLVALLAGGIAALHYVWVPDRPGGTFQVRPVTRVEVRAAVSGFLRSVNAGEGDRVAASALLAVLDVPDLHTRTTQKRAEVHEVQARLRLLETGPRYEELTQQRLRLERAEAWREEAKRTLQRNRQALKEELARLDRQVDQHKAEVEHAAYNLQRDMRLYAADVLPASQLREKRLASRVAQAQLDQAVAQRRSREALGVQEAEAELTRRDKEVAEARAALTLLEAGTRTEEIDAERAKLARLSEELRFLESLPGKLAVKSPLAGVVATPRLKERIGQYLREGDLICTVDESSALEVEILLEEQDVPRVRVGRPVQLKARSLPFRTFEAEVTRIAPVARGEVEVDLNKPLPAAVTERPSTVVVYCRVAGEDGLRPGMTGFARITCERRTLGDLALERLLRLVRAEYWWW
jgi:multidrug resistance efflux pump